MRFYCTSTGPIGGPNCEVLLNVRITWRGLGDSDPITDEVPLLNWSSTTETIHGPSKWTPL